MRGFALALMRLLLHIGTEKTGSTAVQGALIEHTDRLREQRVWVCQSLGEGNHRLLSVAFMLPEQQDDYTRQHQLQDSETRSAWRLQLLDAFREEVELAKEHADCFVISSEHLHSRLTTPEQVISLGGFLQPLFSSCTVLCYLRRQDEMALSLYSTKLRAGRSPKTLLPVDQILRHPNKLPVYFDFEALLQRWSNAFGSDSMLPVSYARASERQGRVVEDFLARLGVDQQALLKGDCEGGNKTGNEIEGEGASNIDEPSAPEEQASASTEFNPKLSAVAQTLLSLFNERVGPEPAARDKARKIRLMLADYLEREAPGEERRPTRQEAEHFYAFFRPSNARLMQRWSQQAPLFEEDFSSYEQTEPQLDAMKLTALQTGFLAELAMRDKPAAPPASDVAEAQSQADAQSSIDEQSDAGPDVVR